MPVAQQHILITGATGGIGQAVAVAFAKLGYTLTLVDYQTDSLMALQQTLSASFNVAVNQLTADLSNADDVIDLCKQIQQLSPLTVAFVNAGVVIPKALQQTTHSEIDKQLSINLTSAIHLTKAIAQKMLADKQAGNTSQSNIIATVSMGGIIPLENAAIYTATKFGMRGFVCALAQELNPKGVLVTGIYPSAVDTPMLRHEAVSGGNVLNFIGTPLSATKIAQLVVKAVKTGQLSVYAPYSDSILSRIVTLFPWLMLRITRPLYWLGERGRKKIVTNMHNIREGK